MSYDFLGGSPDVLLDLADRPLSPGRGVFTSPDGETGPVFRSGP
jgi:hypothetical protein